MSNGRVDVESFGSAYGANKLGSKPGIPLKRSIFSIAGAFGIDIGPGSM